MVKRTQRAGPRPGRRTESDRPAWAAHGHSGEGAESALEALRKLEQSKRLGERPHHPQGEDDHDAIG